MYKRNFYKIFNLINILFYHFFVKLKYFKQNLQKSRKYHFSNFNPLDVQLRVDQLLWNLTQIIFSWFWTNSKGSPIKIEKKCLHLYYKNHPIAHKCQFLIHLSCNSLKVVTPLTVIKNFRISGFIVLFKP